jgi:DNA-binding Xre family transcriptional regulator
LADLIWLSITEVPAGIRLPELAHLCHAARCQPGSISVTTKWPH